MPSFPPCQEYWKGNPVVEKSKRLPGYSFGRPGFLLNYS
jgi:hypothetical protein